MEREMIRQLQEIIDALPLGRQFRLKKIYPNWQGVPKGLRPGYGIEFSRLVTIGEIHRIIQLEGEQYNNHKVYERV